MDDDAVVEEDDEHSDEESKSNSVLDFEAVDPNVGPGAGCKLGRGGPMRIRVGGRMRIRAGGRMRIRGADAETGVGQIRIRGPDAETGGGQIRIWAPDAKTGGGQIRIRAIRMLGPLASVQNSFTRGTHSGKFCLFVAEKIQPLPRFLEFHLLKIAVWVIISTFLQYPLFGSNNWLSKIAVFPISIPPR